MNIAEFFRHDRLGNWHNNTVNKLCQPNATKNINSFSPEYLTIRRIMEETNTGLHRAVENLTEHFMGPLE